VLFLTPFMDDNSVGRTYSLWLLARQLGWHADVVSFFGTRLWAPLQDSEFADSARLLVASGDRARVRALAELAPRYDVVVAVKPLRQSTGIALRARKITRFELVIDVDDPDLEARLAPRPLWRAVLWRVRYFRFWMQVRGKRRLSRLARVMVSNPVLQERHGGAVVPHVRLAETLPPPVEHATNRPVVAFVGTVRAHKGVDALRKAVADVAPEGYRLVVTADPPDDAKPWEEWIGETSLAEGLRVVARADVVVLPSLRNVNSVGQLPVKLVDAMLLGRAVIATDVDPLPWALGRSDLIAPVNDYKALAQSLRRLRHPRIRAEIGAELQARAFELFTVDRVAPTFARVCFPHEP